MIKFYKKTVGKRHSKELEEFKVGSWVSVEDPSEEERLRLVEEFGISESLLLDALDPNEAPRLEKEGGNVYVFTRAPLERDGEVTTSTMLIVIGEKFLMTISREHLPFLEKFHSGKADVNTTQKTRFFLQIFFEMNQLYAKFVGRVNRKVRGKSVNLEKIVNKDITQFVHFEITLNDFLGALQPMNIVLKNLLSGRQVHFYEEDRELMEDLTLSNGQLIDTCKGNLKTIVNIREAYSTILTNSLNGVIRLLTVVTVVLTIPTFLASLFGMNVPLPLPDSPTSFWIVLAIAFLISASVLLWFRKSNWI